MDILKEELLKKRQSRAEETGGRKFFKRSEIEQKRIQKLREEEKQESELKRLRQHQNQTNSSSSNKNPSSSNPNFILNSSISNSGTGTGNSSSKVAITDEQKIDSLNLPKPEVVGRVGGKSTVSRCFSKYPLKFIVPTKAGRSEIDAVCIYILTYGGDIVSGDCISFNITVEDGCTAVLTTQASTKLELADPEFYKMGFVRSMRAYGVEFREGPNGFGVYASRDITASKRAKVVMEIPLELMLTISQTTPWMFFPDIIPVGHPIFDIINSTNPEV